MTDAGLLTLQRLSVTFETREGLVRAVRELSLTIGPGECLGVVGESGAGKSQSFLATLGLLPRNARVSGHVMLGAADLLTLPPRELDRVRGARIGLVLQDPMTALTPHIRIGDQIAEPLIRHRGISSAEARQRALHLLRQVHVTDPELRMRQYPHQLSGGMRQRAMIAVALSCDPEILIADEPTTSLDVTTQAQILSLLTELKRSRAMGMVLITHDMGAVAGVADRVAVMRAGELVEMGTVRQVFTSPGSAYTRGLLAAVPVIDLRGSLPGVPATGGVGSARAIAAAEAPASVDSAATIPGQPAIAALSLENVEARFRVSSGGFSPAKTLRAVESVSLSVAPGEAVGVVGESGSGKSTLARIALRLLRAQSGSVSWLGTAVDDLGGNELKFLRRDIQAVFQDPTASLDPRMTVAQLVAEPIEVHHPRLSRDERAAAVSEALTRVRLEPALATRYPHELSGGQCQRVGIARAIVLKPRLLICDEPVSALDVTVQQDIMALLCELKRESGLAILFISHNLALVRQLCERILVLYLGRMMELAPSAALFERPLHPYSRELLEAVPVPDPDVQPQRLSRTLLGEAPSPLSPPSGCVYRTRCPHVLEICREQIPSWQAAESGRVACHRWRDLVSQTGSSA